MKAEGAKRTAPSQAFPKQSRLLKRQEFREVYDHGRRHFGKLMTFFYRLERSERGAQVGFTVGRALGGSVVRNRLRRRMRDAVRAELATFTERLRERGVGAQVAINPKRAALDATLDAIREEASKAFAAIASAKEQD